MSGKNLIWPGRYRLAGTNRDIEEIFVPNGIPGMSINGPTKKTYTYVGSYEFLKNFGLEFITLQDVIKLNNKEDYFERGTDFNYTLQSVTFSEEKLEIGLQPKNKDDDPIITLEKKEIGKYKPEYANDKKYGYRFSFEPKNDSLSSKTENFSILNNGKIHANAVLLGIYKKYKKADELGKQWKSIYSYGEMLDPVYISNSSEEKGIRTKIVNENGEELSGVTATVITDIRFISDANRIIKKDEKLISIEYSDDEIYVAGGGNFQYFVKQSIKNIKKAYVVSNEEAISIRRYVDIKNNIIDLLKIKSKKNIIYDYMNIGECIFYNDPYDTATHSIPNIELNKDFIFASGETISKEQLNDKNFAFMGSFINKYTIADPENYNNEVNDVVPSLIKEEKFYNTIAGNTPYVKVWLKKKGTDEDFEEFDNVTTPFIRNLSIEDNGVKKAKLILWDKDFGSYYSDGKSLEMMIREAIGSISQTVDDTKKQSDGEGITEEDQNAIDYLTFKKLDGTNNLTNIKLQIGFADYNQLLKETNGLGMSIYGNSDSKRTARAWEMDNNKIANNSTVSVINMYKDSGAGKKIVTDENDKTWKIERVNISSKEGEKIEEEITRYVQVIRSPDSTTHRTRIMEFTILGYKTKLMDYGIEYELDLIESKAEKTMNYSILQRYEEIKGTPTEVLYMLMRLFNESASGYMTYSPVRIFWADSNSIQEELDYEYYNKNVAKELTPEFAIPGTTVNKEIAISLGGQNAYNNYKKSKSGENSVLAYKTIEELLNEFCAACPPLIKSKGNNIQIQTRTGDIQTIENSGGDIVRPLEWTYVNKELAGGGTVACVFLHYRTFTKPRKIRQYSWGPGNLGNTVIKSLSIENANEFAVLSAINSFNVNSRKSQCKKIVDTEVTAEQNTSTWDVATIETKDKVEINEKGLGMLVNRVTGGAVEKEMELAYSNSLYKGTIDILGDPFYSFDEVMIPSSYPIRLDIYVPISEYERKHKGNDEISFGDSSLISGGRRQHYLSGYYVITKISHHISTDGYITTLEVMSYPGIDAQIGTKESKKAISEMIKSS